MNNSEKDTTLVILSNTDDITFEQAWKASGLSSHTNDYFYQHILAAILRKHGRQFLECVIYFKMWRDMWAIIWGMSTIMPREKPPGVFWSMYIRVFEGII